MRHKLIGTATFLVCVPLILGGRPRFVKARRTPCEGGGGATAFVFHGKPLALLLPKVMRLGGAQ